MSAYFEVQPVDADTLASDLASPGYPGFAYLKSKSRKNPGQVLLSALRANYLESRSGEALPWLVLNYPNLDWPTLINAAKAKDLQNKLGFVTCLARKVAERKTRSQRLCETRRSRTYGFMIFLTLQRLEWEMPVQTRSRWLQSSVGLIFGWRCDTRMQWRMRNAELWKRLLPHISRTINRVTL